MNSSSLYILPFLALFSILTCCQHVASFTTTTTTPLSSSTFRRTTISTKFSLTGRHNNNKIQSRSNQKCKSHRHRRHGTSLNMKYTIVLVRHGESTWNDMNLFTGWVDCPLSSKGESEAISGGQLLRDSGYTFDLAFTSTLKRAIKTLWLVLEEMDLMYIPIINTWRLNERHYGALQGLNKQETVDKHGKEQVLVWRRSYDIPPPPLEEGSEYYPGNDPRYANVPKSDLPMTESLKLTEDRFMPCWENEIAPIVQSGKKVLIAAHGNTLRALVKHLDGISEEEIPSLNIPTGVPLIYELDEDLKPIPHPDAIAPLQGRYLGNLEDIRARIGAVMAQTK